MARTTKTCTIDGCAKQIAAKGMCTMHYKRMRKHGDPHHITKKTPPSRKRHGASWVNGKATPEYNAWSSMKSRCENPNRKSTRLNSSHVKTSYAVFCLKKKNVSPHSVQ